MLSHKNNKKIHLKNHDQMLKDKEKADKARERANRFRAIGERMGGTGSLAVENTGHFGKMDSPITLNHPLVKDAVNSYVQDKTMSLIKGIVAKHTTLANKHLEDLCNDNDEPGVVTPVSTPKRQRHTSPPKKQKKKSTPHRPTNVIEALSMCPEGWSCFEQGNNIFVFKNAKSGQITFDPPMMDLSKDEDEEEILSPPAAAAVAKAFSTPNEKENDDDDDDDGAKPISCIGTKTTAMDEAVDDEDNQDVNSGDVNDDDHSDGTSNAQKPLSFEKVYPLSQSFKAPPGLFNFGESKNEKDNNE